jgi:hypothetical protein
MCSVCQEIFDTNQKVETFIAHFNQDHTGEYVPSNCPFQVYQCTTCNFVTKTRRGRTRHFNAFHRQFVEYFEPHAQTQEWDILQFSKSKKQILLLNVANQTTVQVGLSSSSNKLTCSECVSKQPCEHAQIVFQLLNIESSANALLYFFQKYAFPIPDMCGICCQSFSHSSHEMCPHCDAQHHTKCLKQISEFKQLPKYCPQCCYILEKKKSTH